MISCVLRIGSIAAPDDWRKKRECMMKIDREGFHKEITFRGLHAPDCKGFMNPSAHDLTTYVEILDPSCEPPVMEERAVYLINTTNQLMAAAEVLSQYTEIGFDCEMHSFRSYYPLTCLIQISTVHADFIIDTLSVWNEIGSVLGPIFANPKIIKIGHGILSMDVPCLFRDFGIVLVSCFDTQEAASVLGLQQTGLHALLERWKAPVAE
jgi:hypothetical protein